MTVWDPKQFQRNRSGVSRRKHVRIGPDKFVTAILGLFFSLLGRGIEIVAAILVPIRLQRDQVRGVFIGARRRKGAEQQGKGCGQAK